MTYVAAVKHQNAVAILSDMGVSWNGSTPEDVALKTGVFDGCIYGISGVAHEARSFFQDFRGGRLPKTLAENWADLVWALENRAPSKSEDRFELLLSTRHDGEPQIFKYDSVTRTITPAGPLASIGAGRDVLDAPMSNCHQLTVATYGNTPINWQTLYAVYLSQLSMSQDPELRARLKAVGVAGLFHFITQDSRGDYRQRPTIYVLTSYDRAANTIVSEHYKLARFDSMVLINDPSRDNDILCMDSHGDHRIKFDSPKLTDEETAHFVSDEFDVFAFGFLTQEFYDRAFVHGRAMGEDLPVRFSDSRLSPRMLSILTAALKLPRGALPQPREPSEELRRAYKHQRTTLKSD